MSHSVTSLEMNMRKLKFSSLFSCLFFIQICLIRKVYLHHGKKFYFMDLQELARQCCHRQFAASIFLFTLFFRCLYQISLLNLLERVKSKWKESKLPFYFFFVTRLLRMLMDLSREHSPSILILDEMDSIGRKRNDDENETERRIKTEFLKQLDGIYSSSFHSKYSSNL